MSVISDVKNHEKFQLVSFGCEAGRECQVSVVPVILHVFWILLKSTFTYFIFVYHYEIFYFYKVNFFPR